LSHLCSPQADGQLFDGYRFGENVNAREWGQFITNYPLAFAKVYTGVVHRADVTQDPSADYTADNLVYDGITNNVFTNGIGSVFTNSGPRYTNVITTNVFSKFSYTMTDGTSTSSYPYVTYQMLHWFLQNVRNKLLSLCHLSNASLVSSEREE
jgi:hypothetical protein